MKSLEDINSNLSSLTPDWQERQSALQSLTKMFNQGSKISGMDASLCKKLSIQVKEETLPLYL
jgi:hypothetical protein